MNLSSRHAIIKADKSEYFELKEAIPCFHIRAGHIPTLGLPLLYLLLNFLIIRDILILYSYGAKFHQSREVTYEQKELG
jgi:hypothetical protein